MKKIIALSVALILVITAVFVIGIIASASAEADFVYRKDGDSVVITDYIGKASDLNVPEKLGGATVTAIDNYAFADCVKLTKIKLPDAVVSLGNDVFSGCFNLTEVNINSSKYKSEGGIVYSADKTALVYYPAGAKAETFTVPSGVVALENGAFASNKYLTKVTLPEGLKTVGDAVFANMANMKEINLPGSVISIGDYAFSDCVSLTVFSIPANTEKLGAGVFYGCKSMEKYMVDGSNKYFTSKDGVIYTKNLTTLLYYPLNKKTPSLVLPTATTTVDGNAAAGNPHLMRVSLSNNTRKISDGAFAGCTSLKFISIPQGVIEIGDATFKDCTDLSIYGKQYSYAYLYAVSRNINFINETNGKLGDVDGNGAVNISDALAIFRCIAGKTPSFEGTQLFRADVDFDGKINIIDALGIFKHLAGKELIV